MPGHTDGSATVGNARTEVANVPSLMLARQSQLVVLSVNGNMLVVLLRQLFNGFLNVFHSSRLAHLKGTVVGVAAGSIPITLEGFGMEGNLDAPLFRNTDEKVACHPEVISHRDSLAGANLELPLSGHDLGVDTTDIDACVQTRSVVGFNQIAGENFASSYLKLADRYKFFFYDNSPDPQ